jgi:hypothetical protein
MPNARGPAVPPTYVPLCEIPVACAVNGWERWETPSVWSGGCPARPWLPLVVMMVGASRDPALVLLRRCEKEVFD